MTSAQDLEKLADDLAEVCRQNTCAKVDSTLVCVAIYRAGAAIVAAVDRLMAAVEDQR